MEKIKIDCKNEKDKIDQEKSGELFRIFSNEFKDNLSEIEIKLKKYILAAGIDNIFTTPIPDDKHKKDLSSFTKKVPSIKSKLFIHFNLYEKLVNHYLDNGFTDMKISFVKPKTNQFQLPEISDVDFQMINTHVDKLYGIVTFVQKINGAEDIMHSYLLFNLKQEYLISVNIVQFGNEFIGSSIGQSLKNASKDDYVPSAINYELSKVKEYIERIKNYLGGCLNKDVFKIEYDLCYGLRFNVAGKEIESFYLSSIPVDTNSIRLNSDFPYYDQGSLEP
ncbi:hypothetical protein NZ698_12070 [Chryseobacterium sp. PBS4-4]|uniref:Uncharacterized protein n=1 Tax=Chryseobacterium edaphi TaxID=2976532 RepID=A0ABT2W6V8_9FLAO|nr:hypothetical protein [Chryseobacterium edaphi]MCU7617936.1 hypothetical protein [Chryseobacterium edaphi]